MLHKKQSDFQERPACFSFLLLHLVSMRARLTKQLVRGWATTLCPLHTHCSFLFSKCDRDRPRVQPHVHPDATKEYISKLVRLEATSASDIYIYIYTLTCHLSDHFPALPALLVSGKGHVPTLAETPPHHGAIAQAMDRTSGEQFQRHGFRATWMRPCVPAYAPFSA